MFAPGTYTIVSTNQTVTTKAGTFHNVIEVKSNYGESSLLRAKCR